MLLGTIMTLCCVVGMWAIFVPQYWLFAVFIVGVAFAIPTIIACGMALQVRRDPQIVVLRACATAVLIIGSVVALFGLVGILLYHSICEPSC